jgi:predicted ATPase/class 3 adenylate cyclase
MPLRGIRPAARRLLLSFACSASTMVKHMPEDVRDWLASNGFAEHGDAFVENAIDGTLLPHLTDEDLRVLGIDRLGDRKRLLLAIGQLRDKAGEGAGEDAELGTRGTEGLEAEKRLLTVMFCDLVGSTELSRQMDPEDLREIIRQYQDAVSGSVVRYGGHVAKLLGDGVLAYFGWPHAYEDQAERAVRAGLAAARAVSNIELEPDRKLQSRIGIATGRVVVGDLIGEAVSDAEAVIGETPNLAARLQGAAAPNQIVVDGATHRLVGKVFLTSSIGPLNLKGFNTPVQVWNVTGEASVESRFEASRSDSPSDFVGREHELGLLLERWDLAKAGEGQIVLVSGEAGIGKSRLVQALRDAVEDQQHFRLRYQCSPHHVNSAFYPIIQRLTRAAGLSPSDTANIKLDKLESLLRMSRTGSGAAIPLFAALLTVPLDGRYDEPELTPQQLREETIEALIQQVVALSQLRPVLYVVEDVHWIDPTTETLIGKTMAQTANAAVLMVITQRPEYMAPWKDQTHLSSLALTRLGSEQVSQMVQAVGGKRLPKDVVDRIIARADGVPLYVEELTKAVLEAETGGANSMAASDVPMTLQASLVGRLDRLGNAKELAQIGSIIGRSFSYNLIRTAMANSAGALDSLLDRIVASGLVIRQGTPPEATYTFKHALVQDAAASTLLRERKREIHASIANALEVISPDAAKATPELLARHWTDAGELERAIRYWNESGKLAARRAANHEATNHLRTGLQLLEQLPDKKAHHALKLEMLVTLGPVLMATKGYGAPEVRDVYHDMKALAATDDGFIEQYFAATFGLWLHYHGRADFNQARAAISELFELSEQYQNQHYRLQARHAAWTTGLNTGEFQESRQYAEEAAAQLERETHHLHYLTYAGHDPGVCQLAHNAMASWFLGYPVLAQQKAAGALEAAVELSHPPSEITARFFGLITLQFLKLTDEVSESARSVIRLTSTHGPVTWHAAARAISGWSTAARGDVAAGLNECRDAVAAYLKTGNIVRQPYYLGLLADVCRLAGQVDEGLAALDKALDTSAETGDQHWDAELYRLKGELLFLKGANDFPTAAEEQIRRAIHVSRSQNAKSLELRAITSLAGILRSRSRAIEARSELYPVYEWFSEGHDFPDLIAARAMLNELN